MKEILKELGAHIRTLGFKGSGQNFRKFEDDFVFVINIQGSHSGQAFYVNLGAQPTFIPAVGNSPFQTLKEYQCIWRRRVGEKWEWSLNAQERDLLKREIDVTQREFFGLLRSLRSSIAQDSIDEILSKFGMRKALHLARAAVVLGHTATADALVERGLSTARERATGLIQDLQAVRETIKSNRA